MNGPLESAVILRLAYIVITAMPIIQHVQISMVQTEEFVVLKACVDTMITDHAGIVTTLDVQKRIPVVFSA
jgi:hypothetical protein